MAAVNLSNEQKYAVCRIIELFKSGTNLVALDGPAGSGKTTLVQALVKEIDEEVTVSAMTNKAADVLRRKNLPKAITTYKASLEPVFDEPGESLLAYLNMEDPTNSEQESVLLGYYSSEELSEARATLREHGLTAAMRGLGIEDFFNTFFSHWGPKPCNSGLLIIDEASMLGADLLKTISRSFSKILLVGDRFQLPPIDEEPVFWNDKIVEERIRLTQVHRQKELSQPLQLAELIKEEKFICLEPALEIDLELCSIGMPILVWRNETREQLTRSVRFELGLVGAFPEVGETLVARETGKIQGHDFVRNSLWRVLETDGGQSCRLQSADGQKLDKFISVEMEEYPGQARGMRCRFAYVMTCHTAQGSEWPIVMIHAGEARGMLGFDRLNGLKWLYTAVTRAKDEAIWVTGKVPTKLDRLLKENKS
ncbi:MAG: AAA family ATPase [Candidatus Obscuribacter sp.]|nr:AAA family ATPase [Candidatus Obscuribacter sp.]